MAGETAEHTIILALLTKWRIQENAGAVEETFEVEMKCQRRGPWHAMAYRIVARPLFGGREDSTVWVYSHWHAFEAWRRATGKECPEKPLDIGDMAKGRQSA